MRLSERSPAGGAELRLRPLDASRPVRLSRTAGRATTGRRGACFFRVVPRPRDTARWFRGQNHFAVIGEAVGEDRRGQCQADQKP